MPLIKLDPAGGGMATIGSKKYTPIKGYIRCFSSGRNGEIIFGIDEMYGRESISFTDFRNANNEPFADADALMTYVQTNFKKATRFGDGPGGEEPSPKTLFLGASTALTQELTWTAHVLADIYQVQRSTTPDFSQYTVLRTGKGLSFVDRTVMPGQSYYWRVVPKYPGINIAASNVVIATMPEMTGNVYEVGGSNQLAINLSDFTPNGHSQPVTLVPGDTIEIIGGSYEYIDIDGSKYFDADNPILIKAKTTPVVIDGNGRLLWIGNVGGLRITGKGLNNTPGFQFRNSGQHVIETGILKNVTFDGIQFDNISNYVIKHANYFRDMEYVSGNSSTFAENLKFLDFDVSNTGALLMFEGDQTSTGFKGVIRNIEIANCNISDCPDAGVVFYLGAVKDYNIHDNSFNNINTGLDNHVTLFFSKGAGSFYSNTGVGCYGNMARFWPRKLLSPDNDEVLVYNNVYYNTTQYGMFEIQVPTAEYDINPIGFYPVEGLSIHNNTAGLLGNNPAEGFDYKARMVDIYDKGNLGPVALNNNLLFEDHDGTGLFTQLNEPDTYANNIYSPTAAEAVEDTVSFVSLHEGVGAAL